MGIINVTPDSFSDGGRYSTLDSIVAQAEALVAAGADILDVGGESTRPFARPVSEEEELRRVIPAIVAIRKKYSLPISIDTCKAEVARQALEAGADMINDVSALRHDDPAMINLVRTSTVPVVIMHMQKTPGNMQVEPSYQDVVGEILDFFRERLSWLRGHGVDCRRIILDPGIGFGKTLNHNLLILKNLSAFSVLGQPVLLGHSRKRFLGDITGRPVEERDLATAVVSALAVTQGVSIVRVHDVASSKQAIRVAEAIDAV